MMKRFVPTHLYRKFRDSGTLQKTNETTITSGGIFIFELDERFKPYDDVTVINLNNDEDCILSINGTDLKQPLPRGNSVPLNHDAVITIQVKNNGSGTIGVNEIEVYYRNTGRQGREIIKKGSAVLSVLSNIRILRFLR